MATILSLSSVIIRAANFGPTPDARQKEVLSCAPIACESCAGVITERMLRQTFAPTPCTLVRVLNHSFSQASAKPNKEILSSRTIISVSSDASAPRLSLPSVFAEAETK